MSSVVAVRERLNERIRYRNSQQIAEALLAFGLTRIPTQQLPPTVVVKSLDLPCVLLSRVRTLLQRNEVIPSEFSVDNDVLSTLELAESSFTSASRLINLALQIAPDFHEARIARVRLSRIGPGQEQHDLGSDLEQLKSVPNRMIRARTLEQEALWISSAVGDMDRSVDLLEQAHKLVATLLPGTRTLQIAFNCWLFSQITKSKSDSADLIRSVVSKSPSILWQQWMLFERTLLLEHEKGLLTQRELGVAADFLRAVMRNRNG